MNSKERVLTAANLGQPDRVPMDFHGNRWVLERLTKEFGVSSHRELLEALHSDIVDLRGTVDPVYCGPVPYSRELSPNIRESFWGWRQESTMSASGPEETYVDFPLAAATSAQELEKHRWPSPDWFNFDDFAERLEPWGDFAVMATGASVWQHPSFLRGLDNLMVDLMMEEGMANFILDKFTDFYLGYFDRMLTAAKGRIDILRQADDLGTQRGLLFSPELFRTFLKPRIAKIADLAHSHGVKFMFHSCGAIVPLIDDLIEIGVDILDPLQALAEGMDPKVLKSRFGDRICLHGGIDTQYLLPRGRPEEVRAEVLERIRILGEGGGYILAPCHVLQSDVPTENVLAMSSTGLEHSYLGAGDTPNP
ncbi:MAG: uroporphyrinogen decarboxylase family protein [Spirochaetota bacterium]